MYVYLDSVHLETCAHDILSIQDCVNDWLYPLWILHPLGSVYLGLCRYRTFSNRDPVHFALGPLGSLSTWALSIRGSGYMTFCPSRIVSTIDSINSGFCSRLVLSSWKSVQLGVCHPGFCPLWSLAIWHSLQIGLCPLLVLSTLDCAHFRFCLLWSQST